MTLPSLLCVLATAAGDASPAIDPHVMPTVSAPHPPVRRAEPRELLGRWETVSEPRRIVELRAGGTGTFDGLPLAWSVDGDRLTITDPGGTDTVGWRVDGDRLVLAGPFDTEIVLVRRR